LSARLIASFMRLSASSSLYRSSFGEDLVIMMYPSRHRFPFNPGVPDRQLWAIGMVVVQWGMTEFLREQIIFNLIGDDLTLEEEYGKLWHSSERTEF
jgi:hypothetical protein